MFELSQSKNEIIIKRNTTFLGIGVIAILKKRKADFLSLRKPALSTV